MVHRHIQITTSHDIDSPYPNDSCTQSFFYLFSAHPRHTQSSRRCPVTSANSEVPRASTPHGRTSNRSQPKSVAMGNAQLLTVKMKQYLHSSIAKKTAATYRRDHRKYKLFCKSLDITKYTQRSLCLYATHLAGHIAYNSAKKNWPQLNFTQQGKSKATCHV